MTSVRSATSKSERAEARWNEATSSTRNAYGSGYRFEELVRFAGLSYEYQVEEWCEAIFN